MNHLFTEWRYGNLPGSKVYLIQVNYLDMYGVANSCLKLGFTSRPLPKRIPEFLGAMSKSTGFNIIGYEVLSVVNTPNHSALEYALHHRFQHQYFYSYSGSSMNFKGSTEILHDNVTNTNLLQFYGLHFLNRSLFHSYKPRLSARKDLYPPVDIV